MVNYNGQINSVHDTYTVRACNHKKAHCKVGLIVTYVMPWRVHDLDRGSYSTNPLAIIKYCDMDRLLVAIIIMAQTVTS